MNNSIKYSFDNVLVADTKLLANIGESRNAPQILVLNNRLNKCEPNQQQAKCDTCCLQIEESLFKKRSDIFPNTIECFAKCSERRLVGIELNAKARLSGKLVVLGLTRNYNLRLESNSPTRPIKCRTELMIPYARFEPKTHASLGNQPGSLTHYSKFDHKQLPAISIGSAELFWDNFKQREVISFALESNRDRIRDEISQRETLIFIEMACFQPFQPALTSISSSESAPKQILETSSLPTVNLHQINSINLNQTKPTKIDNFQTKRATQNYANRSTMTENNISSRNKQEIDNRMDLMGDTFKVNSQHLTESVANNSLSARFAPGLVNLKELDSIRMRLKTNSFLILTIVSSFVILTYTLCLLVYLKTRKTRDKQSEFRGNRVMKTKSQQPKQLAVDISQPFNLQMEPETRIRLENLLNVRNKCYSIESDESYFKQDQQSQNFYSELNDRHKLVKSSHRRSITPKCCQYCEFVNDYKPCQCEHSSHLDQSFVPTTQNQANFAYYGTLNVMRAIRQAATIARYRMKSTRYQPNLKVIPESDYEQNQTLNRSSLEHCEQLLNDSTNNQLTIKADQIETLLYNAMKSKCCHFAEKAYKRKKKLKNNQSNATLFSRPNKSSDSSIGVELDGDAISRSRIIRHVKNDESGRINDKSAENLDTRI